MLQPIDASHMVCQKHYPHLRGLGAPGLLAWPAGIFEFKSEGEPPPKEDRLSVSIFRTKVGRPKGIQSESSCARMLTFR